MLPSRFVDELPPANVEATSDTGYYGGGPGMEAKSRFDEPFAGSSYTSPGWKRAQDRSNLGFKPAPPPPSDRYSGRGNVIEGRSRLVATSEPGVKASAFTLGDRVFHQKFGPGGVTAVEGNKLTVEFDKAGEKRVLDSFVERG